MQHTLSEYRTPHSERVGGYGRLSAVPRVQRPRVLRKEKALWCYAQGRRVVPDWRELNKEYHTATHTDTTSCTGQEGAEVDAPLDEGCRCTAKVLYQDDQ
eukprot:1424209-Rhodomonas_salina.2